MNRQAYAAGEVEGESLAPSRNYPTAVPPEEAYDRLTGYAFARRYVAGKTVADIRLDSDDAGTRLLAETARYVTALSGSRAVGYDGEEDSLPQNVSYERVELPALRRPDDSFDAVVALQVIERFENPEELVREVRRVLKPEGVLILSTPDRQVHSNERSRPPHTSEMYSGELQELLQRHFTNVSLRRQGAVAGGFVSGPSRELARTAVESVQLSSSLPVPGSSAPPMGLVVAVCSDTETTPEESPYLLLDRDRRVFEEDEDHREDVELLRGEIRRMQETEVQAFHNTLSLRGSEVTYLKSELDQANALNEAHSRRIRELKEENARRIRELKTQNDALKRENDKVKSRLREIENSNIWRLTAPYRQGRERLASWLKGSSRGEG